MDWRSMLDERNRGYLDRFSAARAPMPDEEEESSSKDDGGFFGGMGRLFSSVAEAPSKAAGFFGDAITTVGKDIVDTTAEAGKTVRDIATSPIKTMKANELNKEAQRILEENSATTKDWTEADWNDPAKKAQVQSRIDRAQEIVSRAQEITDTDTIDDRDAMKSAASTAETFLNAATLGFGGAVIKGAKSAGKQALKEGTSEIAEQASRRTAEGAAKTIGKNAGEGALWGAGYGALQPLKTEGSEASPEDVWRNALFGGAVGGAAGAGLTLLDKNVRAGAKEIPGAVRQGGQELVENAKQLTPSSIAQQHPSITTFDDQYAQLAQRYDQAADGEAKRAISKAMAENRVERSRTLEAVEQGGYIGKGPDTPPALTPETATQALTDTPVPATVGTTALDDVSKTADAARRQLMGEEVPGQAALPAPREPAGLLPSGELPLPSVSQAKRQFAKTGEAPDFLNKQRPGATTIELPADSTELSKVATRQTPAGQVKPFKYTTDDEVAALRAIAADDTGSAFTMTRTPDMNLEEAFRKRGGTKSKEFQTLSRFNTDIREHTANYTGEVTQRRDFLERFIKEYGMDGKKAEAMRPYLEAADDKTSSAALEAYRKEFGDQATDGLRRLRDWWRTEKDIIRNETNAVIEQHAGKDRTIGDLGETYLPRVYRGGMKGFKDSALDLKHAAMEKLGGKDGLFNLRNDYGYLSNETQSMGGVLRNAEGIPLNSEYAKPKTTFLSAAQKRTANSPVRDLEDPLTSMMRYFEATSRAKHLTPDIAKGQELKQAIELVNNETGNLRQMYKSIEDQVNAVAGKTSRIDRPLVDSKTGNAFAQVATKLQSNVARSTILGSVRSALAQTGQLPLISAENGAGNFTKGMQDMFRVLRSKGPDPMKQSALMKTRYPKFEELFAVKKGTRAANKYTKITAKPFRLIEHAASELAWRSSYNRAVQEGLTGKAAVQQADRVAAKIIGERSAGARAALYESKAGGPVTSYTLEVNQLYQVAKQYFKRDPKKAAKLVGAIWLYNQGFKALTGDKLNADPIDAALDVKDIMTSDEYLDSEGYPIGLPERLARSAGRMGGEAIDATPLGGQLIGNLYPEYGFRIPFGDGERTLSRKEVFGETNVGRYGGAPPIAAGFSNPLLLLGIPGMSQAQRSVEGLRAYDQGYSETPAGDPRFEISQDPENYWRALLLGLYNTREGREYLQQQQASLAGLNQQ